MSVVIKKGSYCPICKGIVYEDCRHPATDFSVRQNDDSRIRQQLAASEQARKEAEENQTCVACDDFQGWKARAEEAERQLEVMRESLEKIRSHAQGPSCGIISATVANAISTLPARSAKLRELVDATMEHLAVVEKTAFLHPYQCTCRLCKATRAYKEDEPKG